jgi:hypothetical protein
MRMSDSTIAVLALLGVAVAALIGFLLPSSVKQSWNTPGPSLPKASTTSSASTILNTDPEVEKSLVEALRSSQTSMLTNGLDQVSQTPTGLVVTAFAKHNQDEPDQPSFGVRHDIESDTYVSVSPANTAFPYLLEGTDTPSASGWEIVSTSDSTIRVWKPSGGPCYRMTISDGLLRTVVETKTCATSDGQSVHALNYRLDERDYAILANQP